jgi:Ser/Thr protein kinase RdoA (MazF antagonist)
MEPVAEVLAAYTAFLRSARVIPLGNQGGFSGARVWQVVTDAGRFCLRGGAATEARTHLEQRHALMAGAVAAGLRFVPAVLGAVDGSSVVEMAGRCWEVMDWLPGRADFHARPTTERLKAAASALAMLHGTWWNLGTKRGPCPAITRRLETTRCPLPALPARLHPLLDDLLRRTRHSLARWRPEVPQLLKPWQDFACPLQPCLRDVWHDHLLFEGETLTGLVDYAAVGPDSVAADLARMLGSLVGDDDEAWRVAFDAYRQQRPLTAEEERLARVLDRTGVIGGLCNWLHWLAEPGRVVADVALVARRLEQLLKRVEGW